MGPQNTDGSMGHLWVPVPRDTYDSMAHKWLLGTSTDGTQVALWNIHSPQGHAWFHGKLPWTCIASQDTHWTSTASWDKYGSTAHAELSGTTVHPWGTWGSVGHPLDTHSPMGILLLIPIFKSLHLSPQSVPIAISHPCPSYLAPYLNPCPCPTFDLCPHLPSLSLSSSLSPLPDTRPISPSPTPWPHLHTPMPSTLPLPHCVPQTLIGPPTLLYTP